MGSRLDPIIILAVLVHQLVSERQWLLSLRWHLALLALGFLLGIGPLLGFFCGAPSGLRGAYGRRWYLSVRLVRTPAGKRGDQPPNFRRPSPERIRSVHLPTRSWPVL